VGIPEIQQIQPAILKGTAVGFDFSKGQRIKRAPVLRADLDDHSILITRFFERDYFCRKVVHGFTYIRTAAGAIFGSGEERMEERIRCDT
jgi:hypothetical protein